MSRRAEAILGVDEALAIDQLVTNLLVPADAEAQPSMGFAAAIADAIPNEEPIDTVVRPWNTFGVRIRATIAPCGPPRAALVVLETAPRHLRAV